MYFTYQKCILWLIEAWRTTELSHMSILNTKKSTLVLNPPFRRSDGLWVLFILTIVWKLHFPKAGQNLFFMVFAARLWCKNDVKWGKNMHIFAFSQTLSTQKNTSLAPKKLVCKAWKTNIKKWFMELQS